MNRREFLRSMAIATGASAMATPFSKMYAAPEDYDGRLLLVLQADGGWDVTSLCDPKTNVPGELEINHWARTQDIQTAGGINYAPFASNQALFEKYHSYMMVINGVDAQTNSHTTGVLHNWSGRNAAGYPTLTAMFAAQYTPDMPLAYVNFGGFAESGRLIRYNRLNDVWALYDLLEPNVKPWDGSTFRRPAELANIEAFQRASLQSRLDGGAVTPRQRYNISSYLSARSTADSLSKFLDVLPPGPEDFQGPIDIHQNIGQSYVMRDIQLAVLAFEAGVSSAADLILSGHDTHTMHDAQHTALFNTLNQAVDYIWTFAEERGVADRITLVIGSDFGRTPHYNADNGKDHWPISSFIVMEKNAAWGSRQVGLTDEGHNAYTINPSTLQRDTANGTIIYPKHVHKALRRYLGMENTAVDANFLFDATEDFDFFNPSLRTS